MTTMNLKEAFRMQSIYRGWLNEARHLLSMSNNQYKTSQKLLYSKVEPTQQDEVVEDVIMNDYQNHMNELMSFTMKILDERNNLTLAIAKAKKDMSIDIDSDLMMNKERRELAGVMKSLASLKDSKMVQKGTGVGYRFDVNNEQKPFRCDVEVNRTVNFDVNKAKNLAHDLLESAEVVSTDVDKCVLATEVEYESPFDILESFESNFKDYILSLEVSGN